MGLGDNVSKEIKSWGSMAVIIVIVSLILLKFKANNPGSMTCDTAYTFNVTANNCYETANLSNTAAINDVAASTDIFVAALSEPKNWVVIVIIAVIGIALFRKFGSKKGMN